MNKYINKWEFKISRCNANKVKLKTIKLSWYFSMCALNIYLTEHRKHMINDKMIALWHEINLLPFLPIANQ